MRIMLVLAFVLILFPLPAQAAPEWFAVLILNDEVFVGDGHSIDECVKRQLDMEKKSPLAKVRCSRMVQKVRSENKEGVLDRTYRVTWVSDFVKFTEVNSLKQCQQEQASIAKFGGGTDLFFCAESTQLIK